MRGLALPGVTRRGAERTEEVGVLLSHPLTGWDQPNHPVLTNWTLGKLCSGTPNQRATRFNSSGHPPNWGKHNSPGAGVAPCSECIGRY